MDRDSNGGTDRPRENRRDLADELPGALRDAPPDYFAPIDPSA